MKSVEFTDYIKFVDHFVKRITVFEPTISCVRDKHAATAQRRHRQQRKYLN